MKKTSFEDVLILSVAKTLRFLVHVLPLGASFAIGRCIGLAAYTLSRRRKVAYKNLRFCFASEKTPAELRKIARRSFVNMALSMVELLRFPDLTPDYLEKHITVEGMEKIRPYLEKRKGIIFLTGHFGNWEFLNAASGLVGYPIAALARAQKHPRSDAFLNSLRASQGSEIIYKGMMIRQMIRALESGKGVGIVSDQDGGRSGVFVEFFGRQSSTPRGVVSFSQRTHAPIFPAFIFRDDKFGHRIEFEDPLVLLTDAKDQEQIERHALQQFSRLLESAIRRDPTQWLWAHRRWKSTPTRSILILSDGKAGHRNQSLAVFEAIQKSRRAVGVESDQTRLKVLEIRFKNTAAKWFFNAVFFVCGSQPPFQRGLMKTCLEPESFESILRTPADIVISCGSSLTGVHLAVKKENQAKSVVIMKPLFGLSVFEAVIVPKHDKIKLRENVFVTEKVLSLANAERLNSEGQKLAQEFRALNGRGRMGLLVGGDTEEIRFSRGLFEASIKEIIQYSGQKNLALFATSSRRTPAWADEFLKSSLSDSSRCPLLVIANEANRPGIVNGILGYCDTVLVSAESMSMVSEAISSGKRVIAFMPFEKEKLKPKYQRFLNFMKEKKQVEVVSAEELPRALEHFRPQKISEQSLSDEQVLNRAIGRIL